MDNKIVKEFDTRFEKLLRQIPNNLIPKDDVVVILYNNSFEGQFGFMIKDRSPNTLGEAQEKATNIEENLLSFKVEPFHAPRANSKTKERTLHNVEPTQDLVASMTQNFEDIITNLSQNQALIMNKITNMEREKQLELYPKPQYSGQPQRRN